MKRKAYPSDVSEKEWVFSKPYLTLMRTDAQQRDYDLILNEFRMHIIILRY